MSNGATHSFEGKVVVAMSGGVDSSVAALLLQQASKDIIGISMQVWDYRNNGGSRSRATCCAPDDFNDARRVAASIGIPYYVFDFENTFKEEVINRFIDTYNRGLTPNPCVDCNRRVKFKALRERALSFGGTHIATGHYARIEERSDGFHLLRAKDRVKDQSYFLYGLRQEELGSTLFPVGHLSKGEVREVARAAGLTTAEKPESQDICFVSGSVQEFLVKLGGRKPVGNIVTKAGEKVGEHDGIHQFTVGQRRGLNIGGHGEPWYVLEIDAVNNCVVVGVKEDLKQECFAVEELTWLSPAIKKQLEADPLPITFRATAQVRHRHQGVLVNVEIIDKNRAIGRFINSWSPCSPGQAAVFYDTENEEVLGGGRIAR